MKNNNNRHLVWFRNDLRIDDNPALYHAMKDKASEVIAVYFYFEKQFDIHGVGDNQKYLIISAVKNLQQSLKKLNVNLIPIKVNLFKNSTTALKKIIKQLAISDLHFNIQYPLNERERDKKVYQDLKSLVDIHRYSDQSLVEPWKIVNQENSGYKVFSAYARKVREYLSQFPIEVFNSPKALPKKNFQAFDLKDFKMIPLSAKKIKPALPDVSEKSNNTNLIRFIDEDIADYKIARDIPSATGTSQLSAALAVGSLSVKRCYEIALSFSGEKSETWINELIWRDFYRSVIWHFSDVCKGNAFNSVDKLIQWNASEKKLNSNLDAWKKGQTGFPIIDAAMQQLLQTGWMHNRLRMIVASFLTKNLLIDWRVGELFFAKHLFDYDFASNNGGWQWCASVGTDAAPYFRVFNPISQQKRFDPEAIFIKKWLPQLEKFSAKEIHNCEKKALDGYYSPIVDLKQTRTFAIEAFKITKNKKSH